MKTIWLQSRITSAFLYPHFFSSWLTASRSFNRICSERKREKKRVGLLLLLLNSICRGSSSSSLAAWQLCLQFFSIPFIPSAASFFLAHANDFLHHAAAAAFVLFPRGGSIDYFCRLFSVSLCEISNGVVPIFERVSFFLPG